MSTGYSGAERARVKIGDTVAIFAQGPIGLCATVGAKLSGATTIITVDALPERLAMSRSLGADHVVNLLDADPVAEIARLTDGRGVDVAIEALGIQSTFESALRVLRPGGTLSSRGLLVRSHLTTRAFRRGSFRPFDRHNALSGRKGAYASPNVDNLGWADRSAATHHSSVQARSDRARIRAVRASAGWRFEGRDYAVSLTGNHGGRYQSH
jgi:threonine dehydrogenase-like Zn-dependent dehydrogenase